MKIFLYEKGVGYERYVSDDGYKIEREYGNSPLGMPFNGVWVYRDMGGEFIDYSQWRNDLAEKYGIKLYGDIL